MGCMSESRNNAVLNRMYPNWFLCRQWIMLVTIGPTLRGNSFPILCPPLLAIS